MDYMRICFAEMEAVDCVVISLPDWSSSDGAKLERVVRLCRRADGGELERFFR